MSDAPRADMCHNGHPFVPGTTVDHDPPSDEWCDTCGERRRAGCNASEGAARGLDRPAPSGPSVSGAIPALPSEPLGPEGFGDTPR